MRRVLDTSFAAERGSATARLALGGLFVVFALPVFALFAAVLKFESLFGLTIGSVQELVCLLAGSVALFCIKGEKTAIAIALGVFLWVYGIASFAGSLALIDDSMVTASSDFSPNGAIAIAALGLATALAAKPRRWRVQLLLGCTLAYIAVALGFVALWGNAMGIAEAHTWRNFNPMSGVVSLWSAVSGVIVGALLHRRSLEREPFPGAVVIPVGLSTTVGALLMFGALLMRQQVELNRVMQREANAEQRAVALAERSILVSLERAAAQLSASFKTIDGVALPSDDLHPAIKTAFAFSAAKGPSSAALKLGPDGVLARLLEENKPLTSSGPFLGHDELPSVLVLRSSKSSGGPAIVARVALMDLATPAFSGCDGCVTRLKFGNESVLRVGNSREDNGIDEVSVPIQLFGTSGWTIENRAGTDFAFHHSALNPLLVPFFTVFLAAAVSAVVWLWRRLRESTAFIEQVTGTLRKTDGLEERAIEALDVIAEVVLMVSANERVTYMNRMAKLLLGVEPPREVSLSDLFPASMLDTLRRVAFIQSRETGGWTGRLSIKGANGALIPVEQAVVCRFDGRNIPSYTLLARDLRTAEAKEATPGSQPHRDYSEFLLSELFLALPVAVWVDDPANETVCGVSEKFSDIWKMDSSLLGNEPLAWLARVHPSEQRDIRAAVSEAPTLERQELHYTLVSDEDGSAVEILHQRRPITFGEGESLRHLVLNVAGPSPVKAVSVAEYKEESLDIETLFESITMCFREAAKDLERATAEVVRQSGETGGSPVTNEIESIQGAASRISRAVAEIAALSELKNYRPQVETVRLRDDVVKLSETFFTDRPGYAFEDLDEAPVTTDRALYLEGLRNIFFFVNEWSENRSPVALSLLPDARGEAFVLSIQFYWAHNRTDRRPLWFQPLIVTEAGEVLPSLAFARAVARRLGGELLVQEPAEGVGIIRVSVDRRAERTGMQGKPEPTNSPSA